MKTLLHVGFVFGLCMATLCVATPFGPTLQADSGNLSGPIEAPAQRPGDGPPGPSVGPTQVVPTSPEIDSQANSAQQVVVSTPVAPEPQPVQAVLPAPPGCGLLTDFEQFGTWRRGNEPNGTFAQSSVQPYSGTFSGRLDYAFATVGNDYVVFRRALPVGGRGMALTAWVYGDGSGHHLNAWVQDAQGELWSFPFGQIQHMGWLQMAAPLDVTLSWPAGHISGPSNGALDYPLQFYALVLDDAPDTYMGNGTIYVDDLSCSETVGAVAPPPPAFIPEQSLTGNAGGLLGGTLGDLIKAGAAAGQPAGAVQPAAGPQAGGRTGVGQALPGGAQTGGAQTGGAQPGGAQPAGTQTGGQPGAQTGSPGATTNCGLTVTSPPNNVQIPDGQPFKIEWTFNRPLAQDEYFFVVVTYPSRGRYALGGTFKDLSVPGKEVMDGIRHNSYVMGKTTYSCSDTGEYYWQVQVRRQASAAPVPSDPILCFASDSLKWKPWPNCKTQSSVSVAPTPTETRAPVSVAPTTIAVQPTPTAPQPTVASVSPCGLRLISPAQKARMGPEANPLVLTWDYSQPLLPNQYFFVDVSYTRQDGTQRTRYEVGSYKDAANRIPEELRWTNWTVPDMLCLPGFSDTGDYQWTVSVREKQMAEPSTFDKVICQSDLWTFNWTGCQQTDTSTCQLTITAPPNNGQINPESRSASLGWQLNRALAPDEYFFVTVSYNHKGIEQRYGSWDETGTIANLREPRLTLWKPYIQCSDDGWYNWTAYVARRKGAQPSTADTIVCQSAAGYFQWAPCRPQDYQPQAPPTSGAPSAGCRLTLLGPPSGAQFGPETENVVLQWQLDRPLNPQEYYFVNVEYPHGGQTWYDGTWRDAAQQLPDGTQNTQFALRNHLCQPGFSDTGQYTWYVALMHQFGAEKSLQDGVLCQSEKRVISWTGCAPPPPPEPEYPEYEDEDDDSYFDD